MAPDEPIRVPDVTPESPDSSVPPAAAWQPFTPRGIAAFSRVPAGRLLVVQLAAAVLAAMVMLWFLSTRWFPVVRSAVVALPETGTIKTGRLTSPYESAEPLAMNGFLAVMMEPRRSQSVSAASDVVIEFHGADVRIRSLFGWLIIRYPASWDISIGRTAMMARWDAWRPHLLWMAGVVAVGALMLGWTLLAALYAPVVKTAASFKEREAGWSTCWRLAGAALMPGAMVIIMATVLYGIGTLDLIKFLVVAGLHVMVGWAFLFLPLKHLPLRADAAPEPPNPFVPSPPEVNLATGSEPGADSASKSRSRKNPFA